MVKNKLTGDLEELVRWATACHVRHMPVGATQAGQDGDDRREQRGRLNTLANSACDR